MEQICKLLETSNDTKAWLDAMVMAVEKMPKIQRWITIQQ